MSTVVPPGEVPAYHVAWLENANGRGLQSYFTSGTMPFPTTVRYIVYPIVYLAGDISSPGAWSCTEKILVNPYNQGQVGEAYDVAGELTSFQPAPGITPPPITIPTGNWQILNAVVDSEDPNIVLSYSILENPFPVYAYIIKAYDSAQINNPAALTGCVAQVAVYGYQSTQYLDYSAITFQNVSVLVNWDTNLLGAPINTYVETLTLPARLFNGVFVPPGLI